MKRLTFLLFVGAAGLLAGCTADTPAYTAKERFAQINRNNLFQAEQGNDDFDNILLMRPSNSLTVWNIYHRD